MKSSWLKDALSEIDPSCEFVTIVCSPAQRVVRGKARVSDTGGSFFRIEAKSSRGSVEVNLRAYGLNIIRQTESTLIDGLSKRP